MIEVYKMITGKDKIDSQQFFSTDRQQLRTTRLQPKDTKRPTKLRHQETPL